MGCYRNSIPYIGLFTMLFCLQASASGILPKRINQIMVYTNVKECPVFYAVFSEKPMGKSMPRSKLQDLLLKRNRRDMLVLKLHGKQMEGGRVWYFFGTVTEDDAQAPWNNGMEFHWQDWADYSPDIWDNIALAYEPPKNQRPKSGVRITNVVIRRGGRVLLDTRVKESYANKKSISTKLPTIDLFPSEMSYPLLDLGAIMVSFKTAYYELTGNILKTAYGDLGQTDKKKYARRGTAWCSEFASYVFRANGIMTPNPNAVDVYWKNLREYFEQNGNVYPFRKVATWSDKKKQRLIQPGAVICFFTHGGKSTHTAIFTTWICERGKPISRYTGISGGNKGMVWAHVPHSLPAKDWAKGKSSEQIADFDNKCFFGFIREPKRLEEIRHGSKLSADTLIAQIGEMPPRDRIDEYLKYLKPNILNSAERQKVIRAFASSAQFLSPMYGRGSVKINTRQWAAYLSEGAKVYPNNREIILTLTRMLIHQKRYKEALEIITPFYMSSPCHEATAWHDYAIYKINGLTPSCNLMLEKTPEFDIHFCVITKNPKAHQKATLKQLKREVDILNKNFRTLRNEQIVKFKFKSAHFYDEVKDLGCKFVDLGDAKTYNTYKYAEVFNGCTHSKVRDRNAINFYVYDSYSKASGYGDIGCHGKRNLNRPYLLIDWARLNCNVQSPEAHEMGHALGLGHVSVPGARWGSSTNIMCSTEHRFGSGGKRDLGFTEAQTAIILYHAKRTSNQLAYKLADRSGGFGEGNSGWQDMIYCWEFTAAGEVVIITATGTVSLAPVDPYAPRTPDGGPSIEGTRDSWYSPLEETLVDAGTNPNTLPAPALDVGALIGAFVAKGTVDSPGFAPRDEDLVSPGISSDALFLIGSGPFTFTAPGPGNLYVGINDWFVSNNSGSFDVTVALEVTIDIKPKDDKNTINLRSKGGVGVAILSTDNFDATTVDPASVKLANAPVRIKGRGKPMASFKDANGDKLPDLVLDIETAGLELNETDVEAVLTGETFDGTPIRGVDSVRLK